jgi:hypothetical protein
MNYDYTEEEVIPVPRRGYSIRKYHNFSITNPDYEGSEPKDVVIEEDVHLLTDRMPPHFHLVREHLGQYSIIKKLYPTTSMWVVSVDKAAQSLQEIIPERYQAALEEPSFNLRSKNYVNMRNFSRVTFKSISFITTHFNAMLEEALGDYDVEKLDLDGEVTLQLYIDMCVETSRAYDRLKKRPKQDRKLYLSRRKEDYAYEKYFNDYMTYLKSGAAKLTDSKSKAFIDVMVGIQLLSNPAGPTDYTEGLEANFNYVAERMFTTEEHDILEEYYSSQGYEIVDASTLHFVDQITLISEASHVVGLAGGGLINAIFCAKDTEVTILCPTNTFFTGGHSAVLDYMFPKLRILPDKKAQRDYKDEEPHVKYTAVQLIARDMVTRQEQLKGLDVPISHLSSEGVS